MNQSFRSRVLAGETLLGCFLTWPVGGVAEILGLAGLDFIVLDTEHGFLLHRVGRNDGPRPAMARICPPSCGCLRARRPRSGDASMPERRARSFRAPMGWPRCAGPSSCAQVPSDGPAGSRRSARQPLWNDSARPLRRRGERCDARRRPDRDGRRAGGSSPRSRASRRSTSSTSGPNDLTQALGIPGKYTDPRYQAETRAHRRGGEEGRQGGRHHARPRRPDPGPRGKWATRFFTMADRTL